MIFNFVDKNAMRFKVYEKSSYWKIDIENRSDRGIAGNNWNFGMVVITTAFFSNNY